MNDRITRITEMEYRLNRLISWLKKGSEDADGSADVSEDARILDEYYRSPLWRSDFEADDAGELPEDLPRGVLSEDGIYNALEEYRERLPDDPAATPGFSDLTQ